LPPDSRSDSNEFVTKASSITGRTRLCQGFGGGGVAIESLYRPVLDKQIEVVNELAASRRTIVRLMIDSDAPARFSQVLGASCYT
jgi:hypothetical protein